MMGLPPWLSGLEQCSLSGQIIIHGMSFSYKFSAMQDTYAICENRFAQRCISRLQHVEEPCLHALVLLVHS